MEEKRLGAIKRFIEKHPVLAGVIFVCVAAIIVIVNLYTDGGISDGIEDVEESIFTPSAENTAEPADDVLSDGRIEVHFIDVGQGESILIKNENGDFMLIDAGTNESIPALLSYLRAAQVDELEYLILTHPHEDHIGGADAVMRNFDTKTLYMPDVVMFSSSFDSLMRVIENDADMDIIVPRPGDTFEFGDAHFTVLSPENPTEENINNASIVTLMEYNGAKALFTGDVEADAEAEILKAGYDVDCDLLSVAHHGSSTSSSEAFIEAASPDLAVISCGEDNDYGHPHREIKKLFKDIGLLYYRTDMHGSVVVTFDGEGNMTSTSAKENRAVAGKK